MKIIDIVGDNYLAKWEKLGTACRGIIINDSKILLSYETVMFPRWISIDEIKSIFFKT